MPATYRVEGLLAAGGMAEVYLGTMTGGEGFERRVAIKRMLPHLATDERVVKMFAAEAKLASFLHHQNIVEVLDVGRAGAEFYIVMELVNGWDLGILSGLAGARHLPFPPHLAAYVAQQVTLALCHAYRHRENGKQIIAAHRDVSPSNILVSVEGEVKVADFGIARVESAEIGTQPGTFKGKYAYSSPEVIMGGSATSSSDQFALGLVLYEILAGRHPFGNHRDVGPYIRAIPSENAPRLEKAPATLRAIVERMLAKEPMKRFPTLEDCSRALADFLAHAGAAATPHELARYVRSLQPAAPPLGIQGHDTAPSDMPDLMSLQPITMPPGSFPSSGAFRPTGPALNAAGQLVDPSSHGTPKTLLRSPSEAKPSGTREIALEPVAVPLTDAVELDHSERFVAPASAPEPAPVLPVTAPAGRAIPWKTVMALVVLGIGAAGYFLFPREAARVASALHLSRDLLPEGVSNLFPGHRPAASPTVSFDSEPSGARIFVGGTELGVTPLAVDNDYPESAIDVRLEKPGYRPWKGTFQGGKTGRVQAKLAR